MLQEGQIYDLPTTENFIGGVSYFDDKNFGGAIVAYENDFTKISVAFRYTHGFFWWNADMIARNSDYISIEIDEIEPLLVRVLDMREDKRIRYSVRMKEIEIDKKNFMESIQLDEMTLIQFSKSEKDEFMRTWRRNFQMENIPDAEIFFDDTEKDFISMHLIRFSLDDDGKAKTPIASINMLHRNTEIRIMSVIIDEKGNINSYFDTNGDSIPDVKRLRDCETGKQTYYSLKLLPIDSAN